MRALQPEGGPGTQPHAPASRRQRSLHTRFVLGLGAVLLPFFVAAAAGALWLLPALVAPLEEIVEEVAQELEPVRQLEVTLLHAGVTAHRLAASREAHGAHARFGPLAQRVEQAFDKARAEPFSDPRELALIESARQEWRQARALAEAALAADAAPGRDLDAVPFDEHVERAAAHLHEVYELAYREILQHHADARAARRGSLWVTAAAFALALAASLWAAAALARAVLVPVRALREGAARLTGGELSHRVRAAGGDELSELAAAFNAMAEEIEKDRAAIRELAIRDGLTGLLNRREFLERLREELLRSRRYAHPCALLLLDIDRFKAINDTWGHPAGDEVLRAVAARIRDSVRPTDKVARYGGEEFAVLLPETALEAAVMLAERLRAAIAACAVAVAPGHTLTPTASIGVAAFPEDAGTDEALIELADRALYAAKQGGRDRVAAASSLPTSDRTNDL